MKKNVFAVQLDIDQELIARQVPTQRVLEISVQAPLAIAQGERPRLNLALVLDRSGSMYGEKLEFVKQAAKHVLDLLQEEDRVALVAYDDEINLISPSVLVTESVRSRLKLQVSQLGPGGQTNLSGGWLAGCEEVAAAAGEKTLNRCLLLTDGLANVGITDLEELAQSARELSRRGVGTSTFGVGEGFNEHLLEAMSNQGSGNFYYIDTPKRIPELFMREFKELAAVTVREVEIALETSKNVSMQVPGGWRVEMGEGRCQIFPGNLVSGQRQEFYVKLLIPPAGEKSELNLKVSVTGKGNDDQLMEAQAEVVLRYADRAEVEAAPLKREVMERYAPVELAESTTEALKLKNKGENDKASSLLTRAIAENLSWLTPAQVSSSEDLSERMKHKMSEAELKLSHAASYNQKRGRQQ